MKKILIMITIIALFSCKKDEEAPVVVPDYADSVVGTYVGEEAIADGAVGNTTYNNTSKTMTVTKREKNKILLKSFNDGSGMLFTLSEGIFLTLASGSTEPYGPSSYNSYNPSTKQLRVYYRDSILDKYYSFTGTKQ